MLLEIKAMFTGFSVLLLTVVTIMMLPYLPNVLFIFLIIICIFIMIFGDIVHGYFIVRTNAQYVTDKPPPGKVVIPIVTLTGLLDFVWADKKPYGKREFVYNKQEASVIDRGDYPIHLLNGGHGCLAHESCDENINLAEVKYAEKIAKDVGGKGLREVYSLAKKREEKEND